MVCGWRSGLRNQPERHSSESDMHTGHQSNFGLHACMQICMYVCLRRLFHWADGEIPRFVATSAAKKCTKSGFTALHSSAEPYTAAHSNAPECTAGYGIVQRCAAVQRRKYHHKTHAAVFSYCCGCNAANCHVMPHPTMRLRACLHPCHLCPSLCKQHLVTRQSVEVFQCALQDLR